MGRAAACGVGLPQKEGDAGEYGLIPNVLIPMSALPHGLILCTSRMHPGTSMLTTSCGQMWTELQWYVHLMLFLFHKFSSMVWPPVSPTSTSCEHMLSM